MLPETRIGEGPDWQARAKAAHPPVAEEMLDRVIPTLEALEQAFRPLTRKIPPDGLAWSRPEDVK